MKITSQVVGKNGAKYTQYDNFGMKIPAVVINLIAAVRPVGIYSIISVLLFSVANFLLLDR